ncbi:TonB-dependent receptor [Sphingomonas sp. AOB5]|uniref:TonB-dependent receptor n=1 Tax=Sphingomonas sp. AOB5 TaxID=3034017 RepID=UPI0023F9DC9A|nr:TonB-dependent receptor [Sphingomonas sp. AOB5]MDF7776445.1 TonB-dependent receptor [Sphingomonas sp. AOB5]
MKAMTMNKIRRTMLCMSSLAAVALATPALAQDAPADAGQAAAPAEDDGTNQDIVVTAQRREERLQQVPISVSAFSSAALEDRGVTNLRNITQFVPNIELSVSNRPTAGGSAYAAWIRGVGTGDYAFPTDPGIGLYLDNVYMARTLGGLMTLSDIERVEVLRGPQGTLYGRNTIGGAVNIVTRAPVLTGPVTGEVLGRGGTWGRIDGSASISAPLIDGVLGIKLSAGSFNQGGVGRRLLTGERMNNESRLVFRGGVLFQPTANLTIDIRGDYSTQRNNGELAQVAQYRTTPAAVARYNTFAAPVRAAELGLPVGSVYDARWVAPDGYSTYSNSPVQDDYNTGGVSGVVTWDVADNVSLKSITAWRQIDTHIRVDGDNSPFIIASTNETFSDQQFSQEFQFNASFWDNRMKFVAGLFYFRETGDNWKYSENFHGVYQVTGVASDARDTLTTQHYEAKSYAAFWQLDAEVLPTVTITLGGRLNRDEKTFDMMVRLPERNGVSVPFSSRSADWDSFTPKVGLNWKPTDDLMFYGSYSQGFKSGGFGLPTATSPTTAYNPETLSTAEIGVKSQWFDRHLTLNLALWTSDWKDIQFNIIVPTGTGQVNITQNGGSARLKGFEAEVNARTGFGLSFNLGVGYTESHFYHLASGAAAVGITLASPLPHIPRWTIAPGVQFQTDSNLGRFTLRGDLHYRSEQFLTIGDPTSFEKGYALLSARVSFEPKALSGWEFGVEANNITDQRYLVYSQNATAFGIQIEVPGERRTVNFTARKKF